MNEPFKIAVAGLGTIGGGTVKLLLENAELLERRCGRPLQLVGLCDIDKSRALRRGPKFPWYDDVLAMAPRFGRRRDRRTDRRVGRYRQRPWSKPRIAAGKNVVTANKAMIAHHGNVRMIATAEAKGRARSPSKPPSRGAFRS